MDWYKITYRGRRRRSSFQIRGRGDLLEAERHNDVCVSGDMVVSGRKRQQKICGIKAGQQEQQKRRLMMETAAN